MPPSRTPVDTDCLIKILRGNRLQVREDSDRLEFAFLIRGDALPWPIPTDRELTALEVRELFQIAGLEIARLESYRRRFCGGVASRPAPRVN